MKTKNKVKLIDVVALAVALSEKGTKKDDRKKRLIRRLKLSDIKKWVDKLNKQGV